MAAHWIASLTLVLLIVEKVHCMECPKDTTLSLEIYKKLEDALITNDEILFILRQHFFTVLSAQYREVEVSYIGVCVTLLHNDSSTSENFWWFRWSDSPLLDLISVNQLVIFEPLFSITVYSRILGYASNVSFYIDFPLCIPSSNDIQEALVLLLVWVSVFVINGYV